MYATTMRPVMKDDRWVLPPNHKQSDNEIIVLFEGYSTESEHGASRANCSCVLIKAPHDVNIIVDTLTAWDGEKLVQELKKHNLTPDDVSHVVCTHGHPDHVGCNYLFKNADVHVVGTCVHRRNKFFDTDFSTYDYDIVRGVKVVHTPGHTAECVSVIVLGMFAGYRNSSFYVAITGDLFEKLEDIQDASYWISHGTEGLEKTQAKSRYEIIMHVSYIIPGHGPYFTVTENRKHDVMQQISKLDDNP